MYVTVEPSGCCEVGGLVQIRFSMFLDEGDFGYEKHHVQVFGRPLTVEEINNPELAKAVPKVWQVNPFHNHFIYVEPNTPDEEIMAIGEKFAQEAHSQWSIREPITLENLTVQFHPEDRNDEVIKVKLNHLKGTPLIRRL